MKKSNQSKETVSVHGGVKHDSAGVVNPVEPSTAFRYIDEEVQPYPRYSNTPNQKFIIEKVRVLENAESGLIFSSGMAAISTTLFSILRRGDHIVLQRSLYGGTHSLVVEEFENAGISFAFASCDAQSLIESIQSNTKVIYIETPSNPLLEIVDLAGVAEKARSRGVMTVVDNTFASPINQNPIRHGIDVVIHSGTKYLGGHSDLCFGVVVGTDAIVECIRMKAVLHGGSVNAHTCSLIERSLKTLAIRVQRQNENAVQIADFLQEHPGIEDVYYPGLFSHPGHETARRQMSGFGGMLSFRLIPDISPRDFLQKLELITPAMSLGGVESTATIPAYTSHKAMTAAERTKLGISEQLVRLSVGIEAGMDLIQDLEQALDK